MKAIYLAAIAAVALTSCGGANKSAADSDSIANNESGWYAATVVVPELSGKWNIEAVVLNDSTSAIPAQVQPGTDTSFEFNGGEYVINTGCNTMQGSYTQNNDSILWNPGLMTQKSCYNMEVEDLVRQVLPMTNTIAFENDSTIRLNSDGAAYIQLKK